MILKFLSTTFAILCLSLSAFGQQEATVVPVQFRATLLDPIKPTATLFYTHKTGAVVPLNFRPQDLTAALWTLPVNGSLVLYDRADIDPLNPTVGIAASIKLPAGLKQAIVVVLPSPADSKPAYKLLVIDDSLKAFPPGESRVVPLLNVETAIQAGEHRLQIQSGKITTVPPVKKVNEFMMAQTNFYYQQAGSWVPFTERQLQYLDDYRRIFLVYATPGAVQPSVTTIVDTVTSMPPK